VGGFADASFWPLAVDPPRSSLRLRAGDIIIGCPVMPPVFVEIDEPGITFTLDPIGEVSVRFGR